MNIWLDDNGDRLIEHDGIIVARVPAIVEQKWPGIAAQLAGTGPENHLRAALEQIRDYRNDSVTDATALAWIKILADRALSTGKSADNPLPGAKRRV
jgi:hypothetical protein